MNKMQPDQQLQLISNNYPDQEQQLQLPIGKANIILPQACNNFIKKYQKNVNIDIKTMSYDMRIIIQQIDTYAQYLYDVISKYQYLQKLGLIIRGVVQGQSIMLAFLASSTTQFTRQKNLYQKKLQSMTHRIYQRCQNCTRSLENANIFNIQDQIGLKFRDPLQYFMHDMQQLNKLSQQASLIFRKKMLHIEGIAQQQYMQKFQKMYDNVSCTIQSVTSSLNSLTYFQSKFAQFQQTQYQNTKSQKQKIEKSKFDSKKYTLDLTKHFYSKMKKLEERLNKIRSFFISLSSSETQTQNQFDDCTPETLSQLRQKIIKVQSQKKQVQLYNTLMGQQVADGKQKIKTLNQNFTNLKAQRDKFEQKNKMLMLELELFRQKQQRNNMIQRLSQKINDQTIEESSTKLKQNNSKQNKFSKKKTQKIEQNQSISQNSKEIEQIKQRKQNKQIQDNQYMNKRQSKILNMKRQNPNNIFAQKQTNVKINANISKYSKKQQTIQTDIKPTKKYPKIKQITHKKQKITIQKNLQHNLQQKLSTSIKNNQQIQQTEKQNNIRRISIQEEKDDKINCINEQSNSVLENLSEQSESKEEDRSNEQESQCQLQQQMNSKPVSDDYPILTIIPAFQICIVWNSIKLCQLVDIRKQTIVENLRVLTQQCCEGKGQEQKEQNIEKLKKKIYKRLKQQKYFSQEDVKYSKFKQQFDQFIKDLTSNKYEWKQTKSLSKISQVKTHKIKNIKEQFKIQLKEIQKNLNKRNLLQITPKIRQYHDKRKSSIFKDKNIIEGSQSAHVEIIKQNDQDIQKYKGMLLRNKHKTKIYTQNNYQQRQKNQIRLIDIKQTKKKQENKLQEIESPFNFNLNLGKIHETKGRNNKIDKNFIKNTPTNSTLTSPKYMSMSRFHDLLSTDNLLSALNSKSYLENLPHLKKKTRQNSLNINLSKPSLQQEIQYPIIINQKLSFTEQDVKMMYLSIQNALQINMSSQKHRKTFSHLSKEQNPLYPCQLNYMKQFFTKLANVHLKNELGYEKIKQFLLCPYDSAISQTTELAIGKISSHHSINSNMMRQTLRNIILIHRQCNAAKGELCKHLKYFFGKVISFQANH